MTLTMTESVADIAPSAFNNDQSLQVPDIRV